MTPKRGRGRPKLKKEEIAEDYCFVCKDGGDLVICDFKQCIKAYHPYCLDKTKEFFDTGKRWVCGWHSCFICSKSSAFHCFGCTSAVCRRCIKSAEFVHVRGKYGFCSNCLNIAILVEQKVDVDSSEGGKVDFNDRSTYECLFKEYWYIINEKERLTTEDLQSADRRLKKGVFFNNESDSDQFEGDEDQDFDESMENMLDIAPVSLMGKDMKVFTPAKPIKKAKSKRREFDGWGSKSLRDFLKKIGKDSDNPISQTEVADIIKKYASANKLMEKGRKKLIRCDTDLQCIFGNGKKPIKPTKISHLLDTHFAENVEQSEEDELFCLDDNEDASTVSCKRQRRNNSTRSTSEKEKVLEIPQSLFASVTTENIKLVYLKRSLIEDFLKNSETFDEKVTGSFIRVKSDPNDFFQKNQYQLMQVTGITKDGGSNSASKEVTLHVSNAREGFQISRLSDENFLEEEIEDLRMKVKEGLLRKLTIVELEQKARSLHEDLTKHWIKKELVRLQNLSDRANEKGWRRDLIEYLEEIKKLRSESHQQKLIQEVPKVIAEKIELEVSSLDLTKDVNLLKDNSPTPNLLPRNSAALVDIAEIKNLRTESHQHQLIKEVPKVAVKKIEHEVVPLYLTKDDSLAKDNSPMSILLPGNYAALVDEAAIDVVVHTIPKKEEGANINPVKSDLQSRDGGKDCVMDTIDNRAAEKGTKENVDATLVDAIKLDVQNIAGDNDVMDIVNEIAAMKDTEENGEANFNVSEPDVNGKLLALQVSVVYNTKTELIVLDDKEEEDMGTVNEKKPIDVINLDSDDDDDDDDDDDGKPAMTRERKIWYYADPEGVTRGTFSLAMLEGWYDDYFKGFPDFKIWKNGQSKEEGILLKDALGRS